VKLVVLAIHIRPPVLLAPAAAATAAAAASRAAITTTAAAAAAATVRCHHVEVLAALPRLATREGRAQR